MLCTTPLPKPAPPRPCQSHAAPMPAASARSRRRSSQQGAPGCVPGQPRLGSAQQPAERGAGGPWPPHLQRRSSPPGHAPPLRCLGYLLQRSACCRSRPAAAPPAPAPAPAPAAAPAAGPAASAAPWCRAGGAPRSAPVASRARTCLAGVQVPAGAASGQHRRQRQRQRQRQRPADQATAGGRTTPLEYCRSSGRWPCSEAASQAAASPMLTCARQRSAAGSAFSVLPAWSGDHAGATSGARQQEAAQGSWLPARAPRGQR
jgi:hypothetical protein